ncbi:MAG TPA: hypothetical protein VF215_16705 [Thermoanaerobaculia bacterium]
MATMEPNDLPIVCLPLDLSDASAASLIEFLQNLIEALERHYAGQLMRHDRQHASPAPMPKSVDASDCDPRF